MTEAESIKALECCTNTHLYTCDDCPFNKKCEGDEDVLSYALDLIKCQKAEIERLVKTLDDKCDRCIEKERTEAVKAFAERLHKEFSQHQRDYRQVLNSDGACAMIIAKKSIDILVKEMVGEDNA